MSNVRISNGSPTLERMEARQADYPKPSACRNLFGPVDHDALARELRRHRRELEEASRRQWNFDFQRHQPLDGRYEWRAVDSDALPDFYSRPPRLSRARQRQQEQRLHSEAWDVNGSCPAGGRGRSQGLDGEEDVEGASPKTDPAAQTAAQRKRPASDGKGSASPSPPKYTVSTCAGGPAHVKGGGGWRLSVQRKGLYTGSSSYIITTVSPVPRSVLLEQPRDLCQRLQPVWRIPAGHEGDGFALWWVPQHLGYCGETCCFCGCQELSPTKVRMHTHTRCGRGYLRPQF